MNTLLGKNAKARGKKEHEQTKQVGVSNPNTGQAGGEKEEKGPGDCRVCAGKKNGVSAGEETAEGEIG